MQRIGKCFREVENRGRHLIYFHFKRASRPSTLSTNGNLRSSSQNKHTSSTNLIFHVDVAFIPNHGHENYVDREFFRRIRAEFYILNAVEISRRTLESLIEGKELWENNEQVMNDFNNDLMSIVVFRSHSFRHLITTHCDNFF